MAQKRIATILTCRPGRQSVPPLVLVLFYAGPFAVFGADLITAGVPCRNRAPARLGAGAGNAARPRSADRVDAGRAPLTLEIAEVYASA
jgi:hypothetical protein